MLGWVAAGRFGIEQGLYDSVLLAVSSFLGNWMVLYDDYEKAGFFYVATGKR
jgi:hypothetical protein